MSTEDGNGDEGKAGEPMFTRAQMAKIVNGQVKDRVAAALAEYGDLDELRTKAAEADKSRSQLDRIEQQFAEMRARAEQAERTSLVREVADELGISMRLAGKLSGKTRDELLADGRETMEELGIKPAGKAGKKPTEDTTGTDDGDGDGEADEIDERDEAPAPRPRGRARRPMETLRSGAPHTPGTPEVTDPMALAALIPRR